MSCKFTASDTAGATVGGAAVVTGTIVAAEKHYFAVTFSRTYGDYGGRRRIHLTEHYVVSGRAVLFRRTASVEIRSANVKSSRLSGGRLMLLPRDWQREVAGYAPVGDPVLAGFPRLTPVGDARFFSCSAPIITDRKIAPEADDVRAKQSVNVCSAAFNALATRR